MRFQIFIRGVFVPEAVKVSALGGSDELEGTHFVRLDFDLPAMRDFPEVWPHTDASGRRSLKRLERGERESMYWTFCAGLALRLIFETFRTLPAVDSVEVLGRQPPPNIWDRPGMLPVVLELCVNRDVFGAVDLDSEPAVPTLLALGGRLEPYPLAEAS